MTPAASDLGNIPAGDQLWYWLAFIAIICLLGIAAAKVADGWRWWRGRNPLGLQAGDCERCITGRRGLPCACDTWCGETACLADAVPYQDLVANPTTEELIAELMAEIERGDLR
jgi:hypothetical protein